jgi:hypothetical protein
MVRFDEIFGERLVGGWQTSLLLRRSCVILVVKECGLEPEVFWYVGCTFRSDLLSDVEFRDPPQALLRSHWLTFLVVAHIFKKFRTLTLNLF